MSVFDNKSKLGLNIKIKNASSNITKQNIKNEACCLIYLFK